MINGIINVYKEAGYTSHDVVAKLRGILKQKKIGHTGTLDPDAVGVLPVCLGKGTKVSDILTDTDKEYEAKLQLGITTDTQDISGKVLSESSVNVTKEEIVAAIHSFIGEIQQVPPMYSALKVNGKKLYELAREGIEIERKPRTITINDIQILDIQANIITIKVSCSKGTYIRTLCHDIGAKLGCGGTMLSLIRTQVSNFSIKDSITLDHIRQLVDNNEIEKYIISIEEIFLAYKKIKVSEEADRFLSNGNKLNLKQLHDKDRVMFSSEQKNLFDSKVIQEYNKYRVYDSNNNFVAIYRYDQEKDELIPVKMFKE